MIRTDIAVCGKAPDLTDVLREVLNGSDLTMIGRPVGGVIRLSRGTDQPVITIAGPTVVENAGEAERLLGVHYSGPPGSQWWVEVRAEADSPDDPVIGFGRRLVGRLAADTGGSTWPS